MALPGFKTGTGWSLRCDTARARRAWSTPTFGLDGEDRSCKSKPDSTRDGNSGFTAAAAAAASSGSSSVAASGSDAAEAAIGIELSQNRKRKIENFESDTGLIERMADSGSPLPVLVVHTTANTCKTQPSERLVRELFPAASRLEFLCWRAGPEETGISSQVPKF